LYVHSGAKETWIEENNDLCRRLNASEDQSRTLRARAEDAEGRLKEILEQLAASRGDLSM